MKKGIMCVMIFLLSVSCIGQINMLTLQRVDIQDKVLENILIDIVKTESECFNRHEFYVFDFYQSDLSKDKYYLSIKEFNVDSLNPKSIAYYLAINDKVFFVPTITPKGLFNIQPEKKKFVVEKEIYVGGDYNFVIYGTLNGFYRVLSRTCAE